MSSSSGELGQVLGASVTLTDCPPDHADEVVAALEQIMTDAPRSLDGALPLLVLETSSPDLAERAFDLLVERGGVVAIARVWVDPAEGSDADHGCPACGSPHTQPYAHAGPGARVNRKCIDCGNRFKVAGARP